MCSKSASAAHPLVKVSMPEIFQVPPDRTADTANIAPA
jgi:hypothetical protein